MKIPCLILFFLILTSCSHSEFELTHADKEHRSWRSNPKYIFSSSSTKFIERESIKPILYKNISIINPSRLTVYNNILFVADQHEGIIYKGKFDGKSVLNVRIHNYRKEDRIYDMKSHKEGVMVVTGNYLYSFSDHEKKFVNIYNIFNVAVTDKKIYAIKTNHSKFTSRDTLVDVYSHDLIFKHEAGKRKLFNYCPDNLLEPYIICYSDDVIYAIHFLSNEISCYNTTLDRNYYIYLDTPEFINRMKLNKLLIKELLKYNKDQLNFIPILKDMIICDDKLYVLTINGNNKVLAVLDMAGKLIELIQIDYGKEMSLSDFSLIKVNDNLYFIGTYCENRNWTLRYLKL